MSRFAIIADDLSSVTDCGAQVVWSGLSVLAPLGGYTLPQAYAAGVISVDTDSRSLPADQAYARVRDAAEQLLAEGWTHFYKSVDSTLRGNLGAEIEAIMDAIQPDCAIVAPAFPKYGRTTLNGVQYLHGRPLHETEFGTDPTAPVKDADIGRRLAEGSGRRSGRLALDPLRAGAEQVNRAVRSMLADGRELIVVDIAEQEDLKRLCHGFAQDDLRILWVGSTGLAEFVPIAWGVALTEDALRQDRQPDPRPALALVGSASETTREQLHYAQGNHNVEIVTLDPGCLIQNGEIATAEIERALSDLSVVTHGGRDAALVVRASREEITATQQLGATLNLSPTQVAERIVRALAHVAGSLVHEGKISGIVATGGDTANALCSALNAQALEILGEVEAGIPIVRILGEHELSLVTKAGGFGSLAAMQEALIKVKQYG